MKIRSLPFWLILFTLFQGCDAGVPEFSGNEAFKTLVEQCSFGPRNPGSEGHSLCRDYLVESLSGLADTVWTQPFTARDPYTGTEYQLDNIIAQFRSEGTDGHVLLGAHWDTRPWADMDADTAYHDLPITGANDGASGVAVLLEIARQLNLNPAPVMVTIVLFDGEDIGEKGYPESFALGSRYFAENLPVNRPDEAIIVDMVGDAELEIPIERFSYQIHPALVRALWQKASDLRLPAFQNRLGAPVYDDHIPLWNYAGIPSVDIIDFEYPDRYRNFWHTRMDTPDKCSPASLEQVGKLLVHYLYALKSND